MDLTYWKHCVYQRYSFTGLFNIGLDMPDDVPGHERKEERGRSSESSSSSDTDDTSYTISTPSDNEIDNMPLLGTLRADGTLGPPISRPDASLDIHISADDLTDSSTAAANYQTSLDSAHDSLSAQSPGDVFVEVPGSSSPCNPPGTGTDEGTPRGTHQGTTQSNRSHRYKPHKINVTKRRGGRYASKGRVAPSSTSTAPNQASITNPTYDHFTFDTEVSGVNVTSNKHKAGNKVKVSQQAICSDDDESNIYETVGRPTAVTGTSSPVLRLTLSAAIIHRIHTHHISVFDYDYLGTFGRSPWIDLAKK